MIITRYGHSAMHIKKDGVGFMLDPGAFSSLPDVYPQTHILLITHEHGDHFQLEEVERLQRQFPELHIVTNKSVSRILENAKIDAHTICDGESIVLEGVTIRGYGAHHAEIFCEYGAVENVGYMIDDHFYYPGDAFTNPDRNHNTLAAPLAGPFMLMKDLILYVNVLKPKNLIPVHDAVLSEVGKGVHIGILKANMDASITLHEIESDTSHKIS